MLLQLLLLSLRRLGRGGVSEDGSLRSWSIGESDVTTLDIAVMQTWHTSALDDFRVDARSTVVVDDSVGGVLATGVVDVLTGAQVSDAVRGVRSGDRG